MRQGQFAVLGSIDVETATGQPTSEYKSVRVGYRRGTLGWVSLPAYMICEIEVEHPSKDLSDGSIDHDLIPSFWLSLSSLPMIARRVDLDMIRPAVCSDVHPAHTSGTWTI